MSQFRLPDLGEGLEEAQVVQWLVRVGDRITLNQPICQVETAKALVDIPSPFAGTVQALHAQPGESVAVGAALITIAEGGGVPASTPTPQPDGHGPVLVGYGTDAPRTAFARRPRGVAGAVASAARTAHDSDPRLDAPTPALSGVDAERASPLVRKIAAERGIDLSGIAGTGPGGRIRVEDLEARTGALRPVASVPSPAPTAASDEERISTIGLRKAIAARMVRAATTIPHFTEYSLFDAAALVALRDRLKGDRAYAESKLTFLPFFVRALVEAVKAYPILNSRWDEEGNAIVVKR